MFNYNKKLKISNISLSILGITLCLWSTGWVFFDLVKASYLFFFSVVSISVGIFYFYVDIKYIKRPIIFFLIAFFSINTFYLMVGMVEYLYKDESLPFIIEYYIKQSLSVVFCLIFAPYLFSEENIDKFFSVIVFTYILIFSILIFVYIFIFNSHFIGTAIDFDFGRSRQGKNTLGIFIVLIFPFILTYILKNKVFFVGLIFLILYLFMIYNIDSSTVVMISLSQLCLYGFLLSKKFFFKVLLILISLLVFFPNYVVKEISTKVPVIEILTKGNSKTSKPSISEDLHYDPSSFYGSPYLEKPYLLLDSHRGRLFYSAIQKAKSNFFIGSGTQTFRIRDEVYVDGFQVLGRTETHNAYLSIIVDYGILGLFLYIFFYIYIFLKLVKNKNLRITNYDFASVIYIISLLLTLNFINMEYTLAIWLLNGICLSRVVRQYK